MSMMDDLEEIQIVDAPSLEDFLTEAEEIVEEMEEIFPIKARADLTSMQELVKNVGSDGSGSDEVMRIGEIAHDLKGMGGSFGYQLVTEICGSLNKYLTKLSEAGEFPNPKIIMAHLAATDTILTENIKGDGGESGGKVVGRLQDIVAAAVADLKPLEEEPSSEA